MGKGKGGQLPVMSGLFCGSHFGVLPTASERAHTKESHSSEKSNIHRGMDRQAEFRGIICGYHMRQPILCVHLLYQQALNLEALLLLNEHTCTYTRYTYTHAHIYVDNTHGA